MCVAALLVGGCHVLSPSEVGRASNLLNAATGSPEAVTLEIYWVALPNDDDLGADGLWRRLQENRLPADLRRRLGRNGLRAGVLSGALPDAVHAMLNPTGGEGDDYTQSSTVLQQSGVWRSTRQLRPGGQLELKASEPQPSAPLLLADGEDLVGQTLAGAQAFYRVEAHVEPDGRSRLVVTPLVRHGTAKPRWTPDETGTIAMTAPSRDAQVFEDLAMQLPLAAGEALVVTSLPGADARLGGYLHKVVGERAGRKALVLRVVQSPRVDDFSLGEDQPLPGEALP